MPARTVSCLDATCLRPPWFPHPRTRTPAKHWILLAVHFHVRIDKVIQRLALLRRIQPQIAAHAELHAVHVVRAEEVVAFLRMLPRLGDVHRNPSFAVDVKIGPAVVAGDLGGMFVGRQRESDLEARGNALRPRHRDEQGMEVGAVAFLGVAGVEHVAVSPARAGLVVLMVVKT